MIVLTSEYLNRDLAGVEDDETFCSLLVHDSVATFTATDRISGLHLVIVVAFYEDNKRKS